MVKDGLPFVEKKLNGSPSTTDILKNVLSACNLKKSRLRRDIISCKEHISTFMHKHLFHIHALT